jgi:hypothetical protein
MFTAYFDDSGTDGNSDIAIAACYVSTKRGWDDFVEAWDRARYDEGFDSFHMAEFVAKPEMGHKPYCDWTRSKKEHVYARLAKIINENKRVGVAAAVPKNVWDNTPEKIRRHYGREHYTFAVRMCLMRLLDWRSGTMNILPIRYVFDWEMSASRKRKEISAIFDVLSAPANQIQARMFGVEPEGHSFEHKEKFKPLQAADILAWQMRSHMRKIWSLGHDDESLCHSGFDLLRRDQQVDLGFFTEDQINKFVEQNEEYEREHGPLPVVYP